MATKTKPNLHFMDYQNNVIWFKSNNGNKLYNRRVKTDKAQPYFTHDGFEATFDIQNKTINVLDKAQPSLAPRIQSQPVQSEFDINSRFQFLETFVGMVINGTLASALVSGDGGLGKTFTVMEQLEKAGLEQDTDYITIKGYSTPKALYATLHDNKDKLVIFDDCDSVLKDPTAINILKGALDSYEKRIISWLSKGFFDDGLPASFEFTGQVIFISNMPSNKIDQAIKSRCLSIDLSMTLEDKVNRMRTIIPCMLEEYPLDTKLEVLDFMDDFKHLATDFNMRTLIKCIKVRAQYNTIDPSSDQWQDACKYLMTNA